MYKTIAKSEKSHKKVMHQIQGLILEGKLKKGDKLPPERQLAELLDVGRPTLKQALSALEALGLIESRHGGGNYVTSDLSNIFNPFTLQYYLAEGKETDIVEFRYLLEVQLARLAAAKATESDISRLAAIVENMKSVESLEERLQENLAFHRELAHINGNVLILTIYDSIIQLVIEQTSLTDGEHFHRSHERILRAIQSGDSSLAGQSMSDHFVAKFPNYQFYNQIHQI